jgi:hypothetical protein
MQAQCKPSQACFQVVQEAFCIWSVLRTYVASLAYLTMTRAPPRLRHLGPRIIRIVEIVVRQQRRHHSPLRGTLRRIDLLPFLTTPALSQFWIRRMRLLSPIQCSMKRTSRSGLIVSKNREISASRIRPFECPFFPRASALCGRDGTLADTQEFRLIREVERESARRSAELRFSYTCAVMRKSASVPAPKAQAKPARPGLP